MIGQIIGAGLGAIGGIANIIGGGKAKAMAHTDRRWPRLVRRGVADEKRDSWSDA